jgi:hypothetical protein
MTRREQLQQIHEFTPSPRRGGIVIAGKVEPNDAVAHISLTKNG